MTEEPERRRSWAPEVFERLYARDADPWNFRSSAYEREKYAATLAMIGDERYGAALEIGCSIGVFSALLAPRVDTLLAVDCAALALEEAARTVTATNLRFRRCTVPGEFPDGAFDLVVISEVLYFLDRTDLGRLAAAVGAAVAPGGIVVLANWTGPTDTPCTGEEAADAFIAAATRLAQEATLRRDRYRLDRLHVRT